MKKEDDEQSTKDCSGKNMKNNAEKCQNEVRRDYSEKNKKNETDKICRN